MSVLSQKYIDDLRKKFMHEIRLPSKTEIDDGITLQQIAYKSGVKGVIDYLGQALQTQDNDDEIKIF